MEKALVFRAEPLARAIREIVMAGGSEAREAELVADNLVTANLTGHDSHGIGMTPRYVEALLEGGLHPNRHPEARLDSGTLLVLDGNKGYGQVIGLEATLMAIERAKRHGTCVMALANSHHLGRIGHWAEMAVAEGLISLHFVNVQSFARVAPFAGADRRFGTNPVCIGIPLPGEPPFILDMATSAVAQGKLRVAHNKKVKIPTGWLIDDNGNPTDDARWGVVAPLGAMLTFGEHKGYGLAVACELLGGALTGGGVTDYDNKTQRRVLNGMLSIVIDPARLGTAAAFAKDVPSFLAWLRSSRPAPGADRVRIAGEPEREHRARRSREGIPIDDETWNEIRAAAVKLKLAPERVDALARG
ncbi:MAG: malate/lactate/ureidoglycolate dehydrogenase [Betaproteobacteria bacterium 13_1_20CM_3_63_8]|nr:MAG: malate/lactate/ureidoglycolate dehydrogenase [Betaproteobacteria bacterium 13_1_20CM_3_63_8]